MPKRVQSLPDSKDEEFWEGAERHISDSVKIRVCDIHNKKHWKEGTYSQHPDGSITCVECGWGTRMPGYMRISEGKVIDLRDLNSQSE